VNSKLIIFLSLPAVQSDIQQLQYRLISNNDRLCNYHPHLVRLDTVLVAGINKSFFIPGFDFVRPLAHSRSTTSACNHGKE
jgi:hypothetical protein